MKNYFNLYLFIILIQQSIFAQDNYELSNERIVVKPANLVEKQSQRMYSIAGHLGNLLIYQMNIKGIYSFGFSSEAYQKIYYNETNNEIIDSINIQKPGKKILRIIQIDSLILYHGFFKIPQKCENKLIDELDRGEFLLDYQDFWTENKVKNIEIKSYPEHYYDKDINYQIDYSGRYVILDPYVSEYLRSSPSDSIITIYDFHNLTSNFPEKKELTCKECINPQIVSDFIYYGKKFFYLSGCDDYDWKIYRAPKFDLSKSELLAEYIEIILVSPDGKYILGKKDLYGKECFVILNTETKKFDYLLGRDYVLYKYFYSPAFKQFAFDTGNYIIYINYPEHFSFNSIGKDVERVHTSKEADRQFWEKHQLPPLIEK
jgi:hypothetical protein